jgi:carbohydrate diacid regulator
MASGRFAVLHRVPQRHVHQQETAATATCHRAVEAIDLLHHGLAARAAVGDVATSVAGLHDSYRDACDALRLGARVAKDLPVHTIGDLRIHQVLAAVGHRTRAHLVDLVVGPLRAQPDWPVLRRTIVAWCEHGFNLVRASAALYIHRNTLVYRLGKIEDVGGRSLRDHRASMALYIACLADASVTGGWAGPVTRGVGFVLCPAGRTTFPILVLSCGNAPRLLTKVPIIRTLRRSGTADGRPAVRRRTGMW